MICFLKNLISKVKAHEGFWRYFSNTSWTFFEQIVRMVAGLLVGIWVARYLGPAQFGLLSYCVAFVALFMSVAKLGLDTIVVRDLVQEPNLQDLLLGTAFRLRLAGAAAMLGLVGFVIQFTSDHYITKIYIFIIAGGAIFQSFEVIDFYFQSKVLSKFVSICKLTQLFISSLLKIYLIFIDADLFWFVLVSLADQITLAVALYAAFRFQNLNRFFNFYSSMTAKKMLHDSWPLILSGLVVMIYMRIDQIMIKAILGDEKVGIYTVALRLSEIWYFIPMLITSSLYPSIVHAKKVSSQLYLSRLQKMLTFLVWISIAVAIGTSILGHWIVTLLYGVAYQGASTVLMIHIWGGVFVALGVASNCWFISENLQKYAFYRTASGAIINIILNLVLIPRYGISGAAIATVFSQFIAALFFDLCTSKTRVLFNMKIKTLLFSGFTTKGM